MTTTNRRMKETTMIETRRDIGEHIVAIMDAVEEGELAGMIRVYWKDDGTCSVFTCGRRDDIDLISTEILAELPKRLAAKEGEG